MKRILLVLLFIITTFAYADEASIQFEKANQLYRDGDFKNAVIAYEKIYSNGVSSPELFLNLGNAYFKQENIAGAILNYERAKCLAPNDDDINYNLRLTNLRVIDKIDQIPPLFFVEWWRSLVDLHSSDGWAMIVCISLWVVVFGLALFLLVRNSVVRRIAFLVSVAAFIFTVVALVSVFQRQALEQSNNYAIVFSSSVSVKSAPDEQSVDLFVIHEGVKVELLDSVAQWKKIRLADGKIGWLEMGSIQII